MSKHFLRIIAASCLVVIAVVGCNKGGSTAKTEKDDGIYVVAKTPLEIAVVESGDIEPFRVIEVKSRVAGRVAKLLVDQGDSVKKGQLIAVIDPQETRLRVEQDQAQLAGAKANVRRTMVEIRQRKISARVALNQAKIRLAQLEKELSAQPQLTKAGISTADSGLATARQARELLVRSTQPNERTSLEAEVEQAKLNYENTVRELRRLEDLFRKEFVAQREVENQKLQVEVAKSRLDSSISRLRRLENQQKTELASADERVRQAEAELRRVKVSASLDINKFREVQNARETVRSAEASLMDVESLEASRDQGAASVTQLQSVLSDTMRQLGETEIRAPIDGLIAKKLIQEGELVSSLSSFSSGTPIVSLEDRTNLIVKLQVNEVDVAKLELGMSTEITLDSIPFKTLKGQVSKIAPSKSTTAATQGGASDVVKFDVEVKVLESYPAIKTGMSAKCKMKTVDRKDVVTIPAEFMKKEEGKYFVQVLTGKDPKKDVKKTEVQPGEASATRYEIKSGVAVGQKLVKWDYTGPPRKDGMGPG